MNKQEKVGVLHERGQVVAYKGMKLAIKKAEEKGICCVGIRNTNHIGIAGYYPEMAAAEKMLGFITANINPAEALLKTLLPVGGPKGYGML